MKIDWGATFYKSCHITVVVFTVKVLSALIVFSYILVYCDFNEYFLVADVTRLERLVEYEEVL